MGNVKGLFDSFKEFIWDIIGYLLPGSFLLILLSITVDERNLYYSYFTDDQHNLFLYVFVVISYLLGYVIYGIGLLKEQLFRKMKWGSYEDTIETDISQKEIFKQCLRIYIAREKVKNVQVSGDLTLRELRTNVMSFVPEADQKIYTFRSRSDLANHIGNISVLYGIFGVICWILNLLFDCEIVFTDAKFVFLYFILILSYYILRSTRNRFYDIAMRLPLSIYMAKA